MALTSENGSQAAVFSTGKGFYSYVRTCDMRELTREIARRVKLEFLIEVSRRQQPRTSPRRVAYPCRRMRH